MFNEKNLHLLYNKFGCFGGDLCNNEYRYIHFPSFWRDELKASCLKFWYNRNSYVPELNNLQKIEGSLAVLSCPVPSCPGRRILGVPTLLSCLGCPVSGVLSLLSCLGCSVSIVLSQLSCLGYPVSAVLSRVAWPGRSVPGVPSQVSCSPIPVAATFSMPRPFLPGYPVQFYFPCCHVLATMSSPAPNILFRCSVFAIMFLPVFSYLFWWFFIQKK